ncbi:SphA family protein, partial [Roseomonas mucosa]
YTQWNDSISASGGTLVGSLAALYVYDTQVLGGSVASMFSTGAGRLCLKLAPATERTCSRGMEDSYADVISWARLFSLRTDDETKSESSIPYGLAVRLSLGLQMPTGAYDDNKPVNNGANFWDIAPSLAVTYNTKSLLGPKLGQATEFSARAFYHAYTKNQATNYLTGDVVSIDFAATQRLDSWQFGLSGYAFAQIEDDTKNGIKIRDNRASTVILGPIASYGFFAGGRSWTAGIKTGFSVAGSHTGAVNAVILRLTTKL